MDSLGEILRGIQARNAARIAREGYTAVEEPKISCEICGDRGFVSRKVRIDDPDFGRVVPCECNRAQEISGGSFVDFKTDNKYPDLKEAYLAALTWASGDGPGMLVLGGERGVGKTHLMRSAYKTSIVEGETCHWSHDGELIDRMFRAFSNRDVDTWMGEICAVPRLFIDDLGLTPLDKAPEQIRALYDRIIDRRWDGAVSGHLRTMLTTNQHPRDFPPRMRSRLLDKRHSKAVIIDAPDYRQIENVDDKE